MRQYQYKKIKELLSFYTNEVNRTVQNLSYSEIHYKKVSYHDLISLLVVNFYLAKIIIHSDTKLVINYYVDQLLLKLNYTKKIDASLYNGIVGLSFALFIISSEYKEYKNIYDKIHKLCIRFIYMRIDQVYKSYSERGLLSEDYDIIHGLSGALSYLIYCRKDEIQSIECILKCLVNILQDGEWLIKPSNIKSKYLLDLYPTGYIDMGVAHGLSTPFYLMTLALVEGYYVRGLELTIDKLKHLFKRTYTSNQTMSGWPGRLNKKDNEYHERNGWCYGTISISYFMYAISLYLNDNTLKEYSITTLKRYAFQNVFDLKLESPTLCHGYSGILLQFYSLYKRTRIPQFKNMYTYLLDKVILSADYSYKYLYYDFDFLFNNIKLSKFPCKQEHHGILRGSSGVLLTLYSIFVNCKTK